MTVDQTIPLLLKGYAWLPGLRPGRSGDGTVATRLLGRPVRVLRGPEAVRFFYDEHHALREGALPGPVLDTLFGRGAVHTLDGAAHRARKGLFLTELTAPAAVDGLVARVREEFREEFGRLRGREVTLFDEAALVLGRAVAGWTGLPGLDAAGTERLARDCVAMVDGFATPGPRHLRARRARARQEDVLARVVAAARGGLGDLGGLLVADVLVQRGHDGR
ncbi:cytochrome P450, partial [Streptomyces sp. NPDC003327]